MSWPQAIRGLLPPLDPRSAAQIERDLDDEFAFHLAMLERELAETGADPAAARAEARRRFGDPETLKRRCRRIALEERTMLQRANLALMVIVLVVVGLLSLQMYLTQRANTDALAAITTQLASLEAPPPVAGRSVLIEGDLARPGWYPVIGAEGRATLVHELLESAGGITEDQGVYVQTGDHSGTWYPGGAFLGESPRKMVVRPGHEIRVATGPPPEPVDLYRTTNDLDRLPGRWKLDDDGGGSPDAGGATLVVTSRHDIMNLSHWPTGVLELPALDARMELVFREDPSRPWNLEIKSVVQGAAEPAPNWTNQHGRWKLENDRLVLNVAEAAPDALQAPLVLVR